MASRTHIVQMGLERAGPCTQFATATFSALQHTATVGHHRGTHFWLLAEEGSSCKPAQDASASYTGIVQLGSISLFGTLLSGPSSLFAAGWSSLSGMHPLLALCDSGHIIVSFECQPLA